jgi:hypothetical protein
MTRYWPPLPTAEQLSIAGLSRDGQYLSGWVKTPAGKVWEPEDLIWSPPSARKASDLDRAGTVVDVVEMGDDAFITAELAKREKYLDALRQRVRSGSLKLTAWLAQFLGLPFEDGAQLVPRVATGSAVALKAQTLQDGSTYDAPVWRPPARRWVG